MNPMTLRNECIIIFHGNLYVHLETFRIDLMRLKKTGIARQKIMNKYVREFEKVQLIFASHENELLLGLAAPVEVHSQKCDSKNEN